MKRLGRTPVVYEPWFAGHFNGGQAVGRGAETRSVGLTSLLGKFTPNVDLAAPV